MTRFQILCSILLTVIVSLSVSKAEDIQDGFYKIQSVLDGTVLTVTWYGRPRAVVTDYFTSELQSVQEWKIKTIPGSSPLKMIRNEFIKDNAVAKQEGPPLAGKVVNLIQIEYNFIPVRVGRVNAFVLQNGSKCLQNNGKSENISFEDCNQNLQSQQWTISFLSNL